MPFSVGSGFSWFTSLDDNRGFSQSGGFSLEPPTPVTSSIYVTENGANNYVTENGANFYVTES